MAIKRAPTGLQLTSRAKALDLFQGRSGERARLRAFFGALGAGTSSPSKPMVSFYGVSGIGKTLLLAKAQRELDADAGLRLRLALLDLDHERWTPRAAVADFFWHLRCRLAVVPGPQPGIDPTGIPTPLFDCLYFSLWRLQHPGENFNLSDGFLKDILKTVKEGSDLLGDASQWFKGGGIVGGSILLLDKVGVALRERARRAGLEKLGLTLDGLTAKEMESSLARVLHADLAVWLAAHPDQGLCVVLDGFERVQSTALAEDIQNAFVEFCGYATDPGATHRNRVGFVLFGREKLRWAELYEAEWQERLETTRLDGLGKEDARGFLSAAADHHRANGDPVTASLLEEHADALLLASREQGRADASGAVSYYPYYLDLAYDLIRQRGEKFLPSEFGGTPTELQTRFLRHLHDERPELFQAFQCLSLAGTFDQTLFEHLISVGLITPGMIFARLTGGDHSYIAEVPGLKGAYSFHRLMERALLEAQKNKAEEREVAGLRVRAILEHHAAQGAFEKLADCTEYHLASFERGMEVAFARYEDGFIDVIDLFSFFGPFTAGFGTDAFPLRRLGWHRRLAEVAEKELGPEDVGTAVALGWLGGILDAAGNFAEVVPLQRRASEIFEQRLGPEDPVTLTGLHNYGSALSEQVDTAAAEPVLRRAWEGRTLVLGADHPSTLSSLTRFTAAVETNGGSGVDEPLLRRVLEGFEAALGSEDPYTLCALNNLGEHLREGNDLDGAEPLLRRAAETAERTLGAEHPGTLRYQNNLGLAFLLRRNFQAAATLLRRVIEIGTRVLGAEHPQVLTALNNLALAAWALGDGVSAEACYRQALQGREKVLGGKHPATLNTLNNLAFSLGQTGQSEEGELLLRKALRLREEVFGIEDEQTFNSLWNLAELLRGRGRTDEAEPLFKRAVALCEKLHGPDHPTTRMLQRAA